MREFEAHLAREESDLNEKNANLQKQKEELEKQQVQLNAQKIELQQVWYIHHVVSSTRCTVLLSCCY